MTAQCLRDEELVYAIALTLIPEIGPIVARKLINHCGSPAEVFKESRSKLLKIPGVGKKPVTGIGDPAIIERAEKELLFIARKKVKVHYFQNNSYPGRLKQCADAPILLYTLGNTSLEASRVLAVVGTRRSTPYGEEVCRRIISELNGSGVLIVSGLAYGIDACAHRAALENGLQTLGVLGHGFDHMYPYAHANLARQMLNQGGLASDFPSGTKPDRNNFPSRNRIIAGLSDAVLVVEAAAKGGALITADLAQGYDREVLAVPGRTYDELSEGCNNLIRDNKAALVCNARQVLDWMGWDSAPGLSHQGTLFDDLSEPEQKVVDLLRAARESSLDSIAILTGFGAARTASLLFEMEIKGLLRSLPGKIYRLL
jgi:DNA processing protein